MEVYPSPSRVSALGWVGEKRDIGAVRRKDLMRQFDRLDSSDAALEGEL